MGKDFTREDLLDLEVAQTMQSLASIVHFPIFSH